MRKELLCLREFMKQNGITICWIPTDDFHSSEYVGEYFKARQWVSGFTGSAGTLIVGLEWAGLWTDGRYFLQAEQQLKDSGIELCKIGEPGVPNVLQWVERHLQSEDVLAFDGRTIHSHLYSSILNISKKIGFTIRVDIDPVNEIWKDRPTLPSDPVYELPSELVGESRAQKLARVRSAMLNTGADALVMASLADICWLLNLRGNDVACTPVFLSFLIITSDQAVLYADKRKFDETICSDLSKDKVVIQPYFDIQDAVSALPSGSTVMMDLGIVNSAIFTSVPADAHVIDQADPTVIMKSIKNPVEVRNMREAHIKDGVAVTRLMYWLKKNIGKIPMDELSVADHLESLRKEQEGYIEPSFDPIIAWGPHGAIVHYKATEETNIPIQPRSFLLADTGGHYYEGTTDITRTFAMGTLTEEEKRWYTTVLKSHLNLGGVNFKYGCTGASLDILARGPFWSMNADYNHGTGHGVGYILGVHEGPQSFRWREIAGRPSAVLEPGMITSDEPGIYLEGKFGIRLENLTVVCDTEENEYGRFLHLEYLTMVPFDLDAIIPEMLTEQEKIWLNEYHKMVREKLSERLNKEEAEWLEEVTRKI